MGRNRHSWLSNISASDLLLPKNTYSLDICQPSKPRRHLKNNNFKLNLKTLQACPGWHLTFYVDKSRYPEIFWVKKYFQFNLHTCPDIYHSGLITTWIDCNCYAVYFGIKTHLRPLVCVYECGLSLLWLNPTFFDLWT